MADWYKIPAEGTNYYYYASSPANAKAALTRDYGVTGDPQEISRSQVPQNIVSQVQPQEEESPPKQEQQGDQSKQKQQGDQFEEEARTVAEAEIPEEEATPTIPFEESAIAAQAMQNAEMEAKAYENYYGNLIAESNGEFDLAAETVKQDYALALENDNQDRALLLEQAAENLETNKKNLKDQARRIARQGVESLNLFEDYLDEKEGRIREKYKTGVLRAEDDLKFAQEQLGIQKGDLRADLKRARRQGNEDLARDLKGIAQVYREEMENLASRHEEAGTYRSGMRLEDVSQMIDKRELEEANARVSNLRPVKELAIRTGRDIRDIERKGERAETLTQREIENKRRQMEVDLADLSQARGEKKMALRQKIENQAANLYANLGEGAMPIIQGLQRKFGGVVGEITGPSRQRSFRGTIGTATQQEKARIAQEMTAKYGSIAGMAPAKAIEKIESGELEPTQLGAEGIEVARKLGYGGEPGTIERERSKAERGHMWDLRGKKASAIQSAIGAGKSRYQSALTEGRTPAVAGNQQGTAEKYSQYQQGGGPAWDYMSNAERRVQQYEPKYKTPRTKYKFPDEDKELSIERLLSGR